MIGSNPIRKQRGRWLVMAITGERVRERGTWYAVCPDCDERVDIARYRWEATTRKQAKDALHHHRKYKHAEPGGDRSELDAEAARRSP